MIICGDYNIVHKRIDIKNWSGNQKASGCLPHERAWLDHIYDELGYIDSFRAVRDEPFLYSWWSNRGQARAKNVGWRIDYHVCTPDWQDKIVGAWVYKDAWFSDHAPVVVDYRLSIELKNLLSKKFAKKNRPPWVYFFKIGKKSFTATFCTGFFD